MDREIPKEVRNKERNKKIIRYSSIGAAGIILVGVLISIMRTGVEKKDLVLSTIDKGMIEVSVSASGKVVPAFEEIINSPINSRIVEVYKKGGDSVEVGTPILKLDLQSTETEYKKLLDEEQMRRYKLDQLRVNNQTKLSDMAMQIKVSAMKLSRMKVELRNEHYLDSLGAGTTDKVRQAELSYNVAQLEYEQLQQQYKNEKEVPEIAMGYLPQYNSIDKKFPISVYEVVLSGLNKQKSLFHRYTPEQHELVNRIIARMGLEGLESRAIGELSGGQLQRALLGRALVSNPEVVILDEPNTYIDKRFEAKLYSLLEEINKERAIILVSHDIGTVLQNVKTIACVNETLDYHPDTEVPTEWLEEHFGCPIELLGHGNFPHRILKCHHHDE